MDYPNPEKNYHPEDEYETLESVQEQIAASPSAPPAPAPEETQPTPEPQEPPTPQAPAEPAPAPQASAPQTPAEQPYTAVQPQNAYGAPAGMPYGQPMVYPMYPPYPYPGYGYRPNMPVYPQPYPQPTPTAPVQPYPQPAPTAPVAPYPQPAAAPVPVNPYTQEHPSLPTVEAPAPVPPKPPTPTGTKVFIIILCALLAAMVLGFTAYIAYSAKGDSKREKKDGDRTSSSDEDDGGYDYGYDLPFDGDIIGGQSSSYVDATESITLKEDKGNTQERDDDNPDSVGTPDKNAEGISLKALPSDTDNAKYTTQSAYEAVCDSVVTVVCYDGAITENTADIVSQGTGTIISTKGYLITNAHVIGNSKAYAINIVLNNGQKYQAKVVGYDTWSDLAVLKIDAKGLKAVTFGDSAKISIGQDVITVGSPGGEKFRNSLTRGVISAVDRELTVNKYVRYIQSDAAISPGNSGGPLCNIYGQVIGIATAKTVAENYENMSFSIPSATVEKIVNDLIHYGYVKGRARIGFSGNETDSYGSYGNIPSGVFISKIDESGALAGTGIKEGDIVVEIDGQAIASFQDIYAVLAKHAPGDKVTIKVKHPTD